MATCSSSPIKGEGFRRGRRDERLRHRFVLGLAWRLGLLVLAAFGFAAALARPDLGAARSSPSSSSSAPRPALAARGSAQAWSCPRFIDAVKFGDFSQGFSHRGQGAAFSSFPPARRGDQAAGDEPRRAEIGPRQRGRRSRRRQAPAAPAARQGRGRNE